MTLDSAWNLQALTALDVSALAASENIANSSTENIANSSTENYRTHRAELEDGPGGRGVMVADVVELTGVGGRGLAGAEGPGYPLVPEGRPTEYETGMIRSVAATPDFNGVDIAREMVDLMQIDRAFSANVAAIQAVDQTVGRVMDIVA